MKEQEEKCSVCGGFLNRGDCPNCITAGDVAEAVAVITGPSGSKKADTATLMEMTGRHYFAVPEPRCRVGRDQKNEIVIEGDSSVSRFHCVFIREDGVFYLDDLDSKNGTFLNSVSVSARASLTDGDSIRIGRVRFKLMLHNGVSMAANERSVNLESDKP